MNEGAPKGTFVLSLDTELAWGSFDKRFGPELLSAAEWEHRQGISKLLDLLCRHRISATWAFVGHVTLDRCSGHQDLEPVHYRWCAGNWFKHDPCSDELQHPQWYGRTCFLKVLRAPHPQEIGFHSFSHIIFGDSGTPRLRAIQELTACRQIAHEFGIPGDVFVYPRNRIGFLSELRQAGFRTFRAPDEHVLRTNFEPINKILGVVTDVLAVAPASVRPKIESNLVALPGSMALRSMAGWRRFIPYSSRRARIFKGLDRCIREGGIFHLWFHPINLYNEQEEMFHLLEECCREINRLRELGDLRVATMGQLADEYLLCRATAARGANSHR